MTQAGAPSFELVEAAVVSALESISVENGYRSNVGRVFRNRIVEEQPTEGDMPALVCIPSDSGDGFEVIEGNQFYRATLRLSIGGIVNVPGADSYNTERMTALNNLYQDAINALLLDPSFGFIGRVDSRLEGGDRDVDMERGFGLFAMRLHLTFMFARGSM